MTNIHVKPLEWVYQGSAYDVYSAETPFCTYTIWVIGDAGYWTDKGMPGNYVKGGDIEEVKKLVQHRHDKIVRSMVETKINPNQGWSRTVKQKSGTRIWTHPQSYNGHPIMRYKFSDVFIFNAQEYETLEEAKEAALAHLTKEDSSHGWVCYNAGPGSIFWSMDKQSLEHELTEDLRPATLYEKYLFKYFGVATKNGYVVSFDNLKSKSDVLRDVIAMAIAYKNVGDPHVVDINGQERWKWYLDDADRFLSLFGYELLD